MKTAGRLLTLLLALLMLATVLGCSLMPSSSGGKKETNTSKPATTAEQTEAATEKDLSAIRALYADLFSALTKVQTSVVYDDPAVGGKLRASSTLTKSGDNLTYQAKVDRVNPADDDHFVTEETVGPISGTVAEIRENAAALFVWDRVATGLVSTPAFTFENRTSPEIVGRSEKTLTAAVPDARLESFFGIALEGITDLSVAVDYTESAISTLTLTYVQNAVPVKVTVTYSY